MKLHKRIKPPFRSKSTRLLIMTCIAFFLLGSCVNMKYNRLEKSWSTIYASRWDCKRFLEKHPDSEHFTRVKEEYDWLVLREYYSDTITAFIIKYPNSTHVKKATELLVANESKDLKSLNKRPKSTDLVRFQNFVINHPTRAKDDSLLVPWELAAAYYYKRHSINDVWYNSPERMTEAIRRMDLYVELFPEGKSRKEMDSRRLKAIKFKNNQNASSARMHFT